MVGGGYAAARLAGLAAQFDGILHGLVIWALAQLLTVYLLTSAMGGLIGGAVSAAGSMVGSITSAAGSGVKAALPQIEQATGFTPDILQQQAQTSLQSPTPQDPASMSRPDAVKAIGQPRSDLLSGGDTSVRAK